MGERYLGRLIDSEHEVTVHDVDREKVDAAVEAGAQAASSSAEATHAVEHVVLAVPTHDAVEAVMEGEDGVLAALEADQVVVDTGTFRPRFCRRYARRCRQIGADYLDAPVTRSGDITAMVGGALESYEAAEPVLSTIAGRHRRVGDVGSGQILKLMRQIIGAGYDAACAEAVELGRDVGVEPELLNDFLDMEVNELFFGDDFAIEHEGGVGAMTLRSKDLACAVDAAADSGTALPITEAASEAHRTAVRYGHDDPEYHEAIVRYWRLLNDAYLGGDG